jgi:hypothetical protein
LNRKALKPFSEAEFEFIQMEQQAKECRDDCLQNERAQAE